jgi:phosphate acyltransferase
MVITVDAAGGDYAPREIVEGAVQAASEYDLEIVLLGDKKKIDALINNDNQRGKITTVNSEQEISCNENPVEAVRGKPKSSIVMGVQMVKDGSSDAFVSAGNTGAVMAASYLILRNVAGLERPALGVVIPVVQYEPFLLIDGGANADCRPGYLVQFARLGDIFARVFMGIEAPRVGLLNNGEEEAKGSSLTRDTYQLLKKEAMDFVGNVEGQDIFKGKIDVLVTDGFTGNILLKSMEGFADLLKDMVGKHKESREAAKASGAEFSTMLKRMDFSEYGGASLLGVNGNIIVSHGRSKARAIKNAIRFARQSASLGVLEEIKNQFSAGVTR